MSDALSRYRQAEPRKDALKRYRQEPQADTLGALAKYLGLKGYWDRQGQIANESLQMADEGAQSVRGGNFSGLPGAVLGPLRYLGSPIEAVFPQRSEVDAATDVPNWSKPLIAGGLETMAIMAPGPKGRGLGKGMAQLADDATDAERAALAARLEGEAVQGQNAGMFDFGKGTSSGSREVKVGDTDITYGVGRDGLVEVILVKTPKEKRGQGSARAAMTQMASEADAAGLRLGLNADPMDKGISKARLEDFYKSLGFKRNAGNKRDFSTRLEYLREPATAVPASRDQALRNLTEAPEGIIAYHGSPHTFDKFDISKIGTGEGAQAYGHGLYFAENEGVARSYKGSNASGGAPVATLDGVPLSEIPNKTGALDWLDSYGSIANTRAALQGRKPEALKELDDLVKSGRLKEGSMYQVRINAKPEEFLDWDRPLSEQAEGVRNALESAYSNLGRSDVSDFLKSAEHQGSDAYESLGRIARPGSGSRVASPVSGEALKAAGIKGIRYKDAGSRSGEGGTYNYVVFDDSIIDILKRYGIPMTAGVGGAMVVSGQNMPPELAAQMQEG